MEQDQVTEQKQPPFLIYAVVIVVILAAVVWLVLIPEQEEPKPRQPVVATVEPQNEVDIMPTIEEPEEPDYQSELSENDTAGTLQQVEAEPEIVTTTITNVYDDSWLMTKVVELVPNTVLTDLVVEQDLISNFVVFVDNASRGELVSQFSPLQAPKDKFSAQQVEGDLLSFEFNNSDFTRYDNYAELLVSLPLEKSLAIYKDLTPAIDEAHMELGYEAGTFDRKLKRALDFLIDAPVLSEEVKLVAPSAMYQFADAELEGLMSIQKLLLRMGPENQQKVRAKLVEFKDAL